MVDELMAKESPGETMISSSDDEQFKMQSVSCSKIKARLLQEDSEQEDVEYDHFSADCKLWFPRCSVVAERIASKNISLPGSDSRSKSQGTVFQLLKRKVLEHKWEDAALIMQGLTSQVIEPRYLQGKFVWEVGNEIIYNHPCLKDEPNLVRDHKGAAHNLSASDVCQARILYEYGLWLLKIGDINEAREVFLSFHAKGVKYTFTANYHIHKEMMTYWLPLFNAYLGLIDWISWKEMTDAEHSRYMDDDDDDGNSSPRVRMADSAIGYFESAFESKGVWDVFMVKYMEIMEYYTRYADAEETIRAYGLRNPDNPNAHKYWYEFLLRHGDTVDNSNSRIQALSNLHEIAPSDYYMLDLHVLRMDSAYASMERNYDQFVSMATMALTVLMDMLDYDQWKYDVKAWRQCSSSVKKMKSRMTRADFSELLNTVWVETMRNSWWGDYHFSKAEAEKAEKIDVKLAEAKGKLAVVLIGR